VGIRTMHHQDEQKQILESYKQKRWLFSKLLAAGCLPPIDEYTIAEVFIYN